uniref:Uncharacterized protein n=1 Tax=Trichogramma kaykai TaxID=54128 RepID=A0ABD2XFG4_9HYME
MTSTKLLCQDYAFDFHVRRTTTHDRFSRAREATTKKGRKRKKAPSQKSSSAIRGGKFSRFPARVGRRTWYTLCARGLYVLEL